VTEETTNAAAKRPQWKIVLPILFGPVAVYYGVAWILARVIRLPQAEYLDAYPWVLLGMYVFLFFVIRRATTTEGMKIPEIVNIRRGKLLADIGIGVAVFFGLLLINSVYSVLWSSRFPLPQVTYSSNPFTIDTMILLLPIGAGIVEELVWRGYGNSRLLVLTGSPLKSILISSLGFGMWHVDLFHFGYTFIGGLFLGYIYTTNKRLLPCMVGHWLYDFIATLSYFG